MSDAKEIFDTFNDMQQQLKELNEKAERLRKASADKLKTERMKIDDAISDYNMLAAVAGEDSIAIGGEAVSTVDNASSEKIESLKKQNDELQAKLDKIQAENDSLKQQLDDAKREKKLVDNADSVEEAPKEEEVERTDGTKVKVTRYRKLKAKKPAKESKPLDPENIDFTGSDDDSNVIVPDSKHEKTEEPPADTADNDDIDTADATEESTDVDGTQMDDSDDNIEDVDTNGIDPFEFL